MTRLEKVIEQVKIRRNQDKRYRPWIYDDNGNIKEDVICGDILPFLEDLKPYEIPIKERAIENIYNHCDFDDNTYNYNANVDCNLQIFGKKVNDGWLYVMAVHLYGDIRVGYSEQFAIKTDYELEFMEMENVIQNKYLNDRYCADINIFSESYDIYDYTINDYINGTFYYIEKEAVLKELEERKAS